MSPNMKMVPRARLVPSMDRRITRSMTAATKPGIPVTNQTKTQPDFTKMKVKKVASKTVSRRKLGSQNTFHLPIRSLIPLFPGLMPNVDSKYTIDPKHSLDPKQFLDPKSFPFMKLLPELRIEVYKNLLLPHVPVKISIKSWNEYIGVSVDTCSRLSTPLPKFHKQILEVSRKIHAEASVILYNREFHFDFSSEIWVYRKLSGTSICATFLETLRPMYREMITNIHIAELKGRDGLIGSLRSCPSLRTLTIGMSQNIYELAWGGGYRHLLLEESPAIKELLTINPVDTLNLIDLSDLDSKDDAAAIKDKLNALLRRKLVLPRD